MGFEQDRPLQFHNDSEIQQQPISPYSTFTLGVDRKVYRAASRPEYNAKSTDLHSDHQYCPCRFMTAEEYEYIKARELKGV